jgi:serine/threonine-protein kinase SRPK3
MLRADCYGGHHDIFEREILSQISEVSRRSSHQGRNYVSHLLEQFTHTGPNGEHVCLAFDVLGHHLDFQAAKYEDGKIPVRAVKVIARQLLLGLDFLHRECGIIHTGMANPNISHLLYCWHLLILRIDLKPTNILLELENPNSTISHYLSEVPARISSQLHVAAPLREVIPTSLVSETKNLHVRLIDFGVGR